MGRRGNSGSLHYAPPVGMTILLQRQRLSRHTVPAFTELSSRPEESWAFGPPRRMKNMRTRKLWVPHISRSQMWEGCQTAFG